jgi:hypothetical protein
VLVDHQRRALGDRQHEDEVEEELERLDPLALSHHGAQPGATRLVLARQGGESCTTVAGSRRQAINIHRHDSWIT